MTITPAPDVGLPSRTGPEERDYLLKRAEDHRLMADTTEEAGAKMIHIQFEQLYTARALRLAAVQQD